MSTGSDTVRESVVSHDRGRENHSPDAAIRIADIACSTTEDGEDERKSGFDFLMAVEKSRLLRRQRETVDLLETSRILADRTTEIPTSELESRSDNTGPDFVFEDSDVADTLAETCHHLQACFRVGAKICLVNRPNRTARSDQTPQTVPTRTRPTGDIFSVLAAAAGPAVIEGATGIAREMVDELAFRTAWTQIGLPYTYGLRPIVQWIRENVGKEELKSVLKTTSGFIQDVYEVFADAYRADEGIRATELEKWVRRMNDEHERENASARRSDTVLTEWRRDLQSRTDVVYSKLMRYFGDDSFIGIDMSNEARVIEAELRGAKRRRTELDKRIPESVHDINIEYRRWLTSIGDLVQNSLDALATTERGIESFASQVSAVCGVANSVLVSGADAPVTIMKKLRALRDTIKSEEQSVIRLEEDTLLRQADEIAAPIVPAGRYMSRLGRQARSLPLPPLDTKSLRYEGDSVVNASGNLDNAWRLLVWAECFLVAEHTSWDAEWTRLRAPGVEMLETAATTSGGFIVPYSLDVTQTDLQQMYNEVVRRHLDFETWCTETREIWGDAPTSEEEWNRQSALLAWKKKKFAAECADTIMSETVSKSDVDIRRVVVQALRLGARNRVPKDKWTTLLSEHPFRAARSNDAVDYDVFAWPTYDKSDGDDTLPGHITMPHLIYLAMLQGIEKKMRQSDPRAENAKPRLGKFFNPTKYQLDELLDSTESLDRMTSLQIEEVGLVLTTPGDPAIGRYTRGDKGKSFAVEHPSDNDMKKYSKELRGLVAPRPVRHKSASNPLLHGISPEQLDSTRPADAPVLPRFHAIPPTTSPPRQDLALLPNSTCDFGIKVCVLHEKTCYAIDAVLWPVLGEDNTFRSSMAISRERDATTPCFLSAHDGTLAVLYPPDTEDEDSSAGSFFIAKLSADFPKKLRELHKIRVAAEREYDWYATWMSNRVWEVESKLSKQSKRVLVKGINDPIIDLPKFPADEGSEGGEYEIIDVSISGIVEKIPMFDTNSVACLADVVSVREDGEWAVSGGSNVAYGVRGVMRSSTDDWFTDRCWKTMPSSFQTGLREEIERHLLSLMNVYETHMQSMRLEEERRAISTFDPTMEVGTRIQHEIERMRTATLVYQMAVRVTDDLRRSFKDHLAVEGVDATLMMDPTRNDFFSNFYTMVAFEVHASMLTHSLRLFVLYFQMGQVMKYDIRAIVSDV